MSQDPLRALRDVGQSAWYGYFRGRLARAEFFLALVERGSIRGAMLDPMVFARLAQSGDGLASRHRSGDPATTGVAESRPGAGGQLDRALVDELRVGVRLFGALHRSSGGDDGFVAVAMSPAVSRRPDESLVRGRRLLAEVGRPNLMLRVPATPDRAETIEGLVAAGMSVAVTCVYGVEHATAGLRAAYRGLVRCARGHQDATAVRVLLVVNPRRIDLIVDELLEVRARAGKGNDDVAEALRAQSGIAVARAVRRAVAAVLAGPEWRALRDAGIAAPRLCWEGTTCGDPRERDVRYVEQLAGPDTVVSLAPTTIAALRDHGRIVDRSSSGRETSESLLEDLDALGIDVDEVADDLQGREVEHRAAIGRALASPGFALERGEPGGIVAWLPGPVRAELDRCLEDLRERRVAERLWLGDPEGHAGGSGTDTHRAWAWLHGIEALREEILPIARFARRVTAGRERRVLLIGNDGGALAARAGADVFELPSFLALDGIEPGSVARVERAVDPGTDLLVVASRSGDSPDVATLASRLEARWAGADPECSRRLVAVTDPGTPLHARAAAAGFRGVWLESPEIAASYSGLSRTGLVPLALAGVDVSALAAGAHSMALSCAPEVDGPENPGLLLGAFLAACHRIGRDKVTLLTTGRLAGLGPWIEQLLVAATAGDGRGVIPIVDEPPGPVAAYGSDRAFVQLGMESEEDPAAESFARRLRSAGHPVTRWSLIDRHDLGGELLRWQVGAAAAAELMGRGPVAPGGGRGVAEEGPEPSVGPSTPPGPAAREGRVDRDPADLVRWSRALVSGLRPPRYLDIQAFLTPSVRVRTTLQRLRGSLRDARGVATTLGWGPAFLAYTGALHRSGPYSGIHLQILPERRSRRADPRLADAVRLRARAHRQVLLAGGRRVLRMELGRDPADDLQRLAEAVEAALDEGAPRS